VTQVQALANIRSEDSPRVGSEHASRTPALRPSSSVSCFLQHMRQRLLLPANTRTKHRHRGEDMLSSCMALSPTPHPPQNQQLRSRRRKMMQKKASRGPFLWTVTVVSNRDLVRKETCTERGVHSVVATGRSNCHATSPQESLPLNACRTDAAISVTVPQRCVLFYSWQPTGDNLVIRYCPPSPTHPPQNQ